MSEHRIFVRGDLDMATAPALLTDLQNAIATTDGTLVLDCKDLTFLDSSGVRVFITAHQNLQARERQMQIVNLAPGPTRVLEILGLSDQLVIDGRVAAD